LRQLFRYRFFASSHCLGISILLYELYSTVTMSSLEPLLHPYAILDFLARERIPELVKIPLVERYHKAILVDPDAAIQTCRTLMSSWVVDMFEAGPLWDANAYVLPP
jgi:hypothetical protein